MNRSKVITKSSTIQTPSNAAHVTWTNERNIEEDTIGLQEGPTAFSDSRMIKRLKTESTTQAAMAEADAKLLRMLALKGEIPPSANDVGFGKELRVLKSKLKPKKWVKKHKDPARAAIDSFIKGKSPPVPKCKPSNSDIWVEQQVRYERDKAFIASASQEFDEMEGERKFNMRNRKMQHEAESFLFGPELRSVMDRKTERNFREVFKHMRDAFSHTEKYNSESVEYWIKMMERVLLHFIILSDCKSLMGVTATILNFVSSVRDKSLTSEVRDLMDRFFRNEGMMHQDGVETLRGQNFLTALRSINRCWKSVTKGAFFKQISKIVTLLLVVGYMPKDIENSVIVSRLKDNDFMNKMEKGQYSGIEVTDAIINSTLCIAETGVACYRDQSFVPLLWTNDEAAEFEDRYSNVLSMWDLVRHGNHKQWPSPLTDEIFKAELEEVTTHFKTQRKQSHLDPMLNRLISMRLMELGKILHDFDRNMGDQTRIPPFMLSFWGGSGTGKSTTIKRTFELLDAARKIKHNPADFVNVLIGKTFEQIQGTTRGIGLDDVANTKAEKQQGEMTESIFIIRVKNSTQFTVPKADLPDKGKVNFTGDYFWTTSNKQDFDAGLYSNCPFSIQNRPEILVEMKVKREFQRGNSGGLCSAKANAWRQAQMAHNDEVIDDFWELTLTEPVEPEDLTQVAEYRDVVWHRKDGTKITMRDVSYQTYIAYTTELALEYFEREEALFKANKVHGKKEFKKCSAEGCEMPAFSCPKHAHLPELSRPRTVEMSTQTQAQLARNQTEAEVNRFWAADQGVGLSKNFSIHCHECNKLVPAPQPWKSVVYHCKFCRKRFEFRTLSKDSYQTLKYSGGTGSVAIHHQDRSDPPVAEVVGTQPLDPPERRVVKNPEIVEYYLVGYKIPDKANFIFDRRDKVYDWLYDRYSYWAESKYTAHEDRTTYTQVYAYYTYLYPYVPTIRGFFSDRLSLVMFRRFYVYIWAFLCGLNLVHLYLLYLSYYDDNSYLLYVLLLGTFQYIAVALYSACCKQLSNFLVWKHSGNIGQIFGIVKRMVVDSIVIFSMLYVAFKTYQAFRCGARMLQHQGGGHSTLIEPPDPVNKKAAEEEEEHLESKEKHDKARERITKVNPWKAVKRKVIPMTQLSRSTSNVDHLLERIKHNSYRAKFIMQNEENSNVIERTSRGQITVLCNHYISFPKHYLHLSKKLSIQAFKHSAEFGEFWTLRIQPENTFTTSWSDVAICRVDELGCDHFNLLEYLAKRCVTSSTSYVCYYMDTNLNESVVRGRLQPGGYTTPIQHYPDGLWDCRRAEPSEQGDCGALAVSTEGGFAIVGLHSAGQIVDGANHTIFAPISKTMVDEAMEHFNNCLVIPDMIINSDVQPRKQIMGAQITKEGDLHPKSPVNFQGNHTWQYLAPCVGRSTPKVTGEDTVYRKDVEESFSHLFPNNEVPEYQKPKINPHWEKPQATLATAAQPALPICPKLMKRACDDWCGPYIDLIPGMPEELASIMRPLTDEENVNGIDGIRFIDAIRPDTAFGTPQPGVKEQYMEDDVDVTDAYESTTLDALKRILPHQTEEHLDEIAEVIDEDSGNDGVKRRRWVREVQEMLKEVDEELRSGKRVGIPSKACFKDEIVKKLKCRIFFANHTAIIFAVRKYFLPICAFMQAYPFVGECMVGLNAHSEEWDELHHFLHDGAKGIFGGDFKDWDSRMSAQLIYNAIGCMIKIAMHMEMYTAADIKAMYSLREELTYPYVLYFGDLISFRSGTHVSGNAITVFINSIGNSLLNRCAFFDANPKEKNFRDHVALIVYGDDNNGADKTGKFDNIVMEKFCRKHGFVYTMPNKTDKMEKYIGEIDFVSRTSCKGKDGIYRGGLKNDSWLKCLCMGTTSKIPKRERDAIVFEPSLLEAAIKGEEFYNMAAPKLRAIAEKYQMEHNVGNMYKTYEQQMEGNLKEENLPPESDTHISC